jgi:hypothetical protein
MAADRTAQSTGGARDSYRTSGQILRVLFQVFVYVHSVSLFLKNGKAATAMDSRR